MYVNLLSSFVFPGSNCNISFLARRQACGLDMTEWKNFWEGREEGIKEGVRRPIVETLHLCEIHH